MMDEMDEDDLDEVLANMPIPEPEVVEKNSSGDGADAPEEGGSGGSSEVSTNTAPSTLSLPGTSKASSGSSKGILVNPRQRGNPVLKHIRSVPWEYSEVVPDYVLGPTSCALFLSIRYYNLHPDYIHERLKEIKYSYALRVLLVMLDVPDPYPILKTLTHLGMLADLTIMPCHGAEEAGRILENYKIYENKPPEMIQEKQDSSSSQQVMDALTSIRSVNKTDAVTLLRVFGTLAKLIDAPPERIALCPGVGPQKAQRIYAALHEPFRNTL